MTKPRGAICNLDCTYCYYLSKEMLYTGSHFRMSNELLEEYIRQYIAAQCVPAVTFVWQGGEPTLMGLDFFQTAVELQDKYSKPGIRIENALQTNGTILDDEWCQFLREHDFLVGISLDGPRALHNIYRKGKDGSPTFDRVMAGIELLKKHRVDFNVLVCVSTANVEHPLEVYRFIRDEVNARFMQFIPIVERNDKASCQEMGVVTDCSITGKQYGHFLVSIFDEWVRHDVGRVSLQIIDTALANWLGEPGGLCVFSETCGAGLALEHNGDLYSCDHFVDPAYKLGNIFEVSLAAMAASEQQRQFGLDKLQTLPRFCLECEVRSMCNGGCPKNRISYTPDGEPGLNHLCEGYKIFFNHIKPAMAFMKAELHAGRSPANIMFHLAKQALELQKKFEAANRNDPCPCGSGRKYKHCHGQRR
jgi:uncharacterized protein